MAATTKNRAKTPRKRSTANGANGSGNGKHARNLVIVESPAKARTVQNILGDDYEVLASVGHVRDLPVAGYGLENFETFQPKYRNLKDKSQVIKDLAQAAKRADRVFLSTDPDREGEAIAWHVMEAAEIPEERTSRVVFHEITKPAIEEAFSHPGKLDMDLVEAQQTRRVMDRLIGYPLTWFVQGKVSKSASAGRVQSVALRLIVEREKEIQEFVPREYWTLHALLAKKTGQRAQFKADLVKLPDQKGKPKIGDADLANRLVKTFEQSDFSVATVKKGQRKRSPAAPFTTSTFQQAANNRLGIGASRAMGAAQALYEGIEIPGQGPVGLITYMRTDSVNVAAPARLEAREFAKQRWGDDHVPDKERVYRTRSKGAQEAHEAIRPTSPSRTPESLRGVLSNELLSVYRLIWERFMASQMADALYRTVQVEIEAREAGELRGTFRASSQELEFAGHLAVQGDGRSTEEDDDPEAEENAETRLPELEQGEALDRRNIEPVQHFTEPPPRFTEASLVKLLEELGIGRPSTYASIVQTVQKRDYVRKQGKALVPQELGFLVNDMLVEHLGRYVTPEFTSNLENTLDDVAEGRAEYLPVVSGFWGEFEKEMETAKQTAEKQQTETDVVCSECGQANMVIKWGRNGKFMACPRFPDCKHTMPLTQEGEPIPVSGPRPLEGYTCPRCGGTLIQKTGPFGPYVDCEHREEGSCDFRSGVPVGVACPEEPETGQLVEKRTRRGTFYACWNYPNCSYTTKSIEPGEIAPARPEDVREEANKKLIQRSARGKAAFAKRRSNARARKAG